jgi:hypothetical protein
MRLTIPQIIMLNHGAHINWLRSEERSKQRSADKQKAEDNPIVFNGKTVDQLTGPEFAAYWNTGMGGEDVHDSS